jgi:hypothetical protein
MMHSTRRVVALAVLACPLCTVLVTGCGAIGSGEFTRAAAQAILDKSLAASPDRESGPWNSFTGCGPGIVNLVSSVTVDGITSVDSGRKASFSFRTRQGSEGKGEAYFRSYDDGWRVEVARLMSISTCR